MPRCVHAAGSPSFLFLTGPRTRRPFNLVSFGLAGWTIRLACAALTGPFPFHLGNSLLTFLPVHKLNDQHQYEHNQCALQYDQAHSAPPVLAFEGIMPQLAFHTTYPQLPGVQPEFEKETFLEYRRQKMVKTG